MTDILRLIFCTKLHRMGKSTAAETSLYCLLLGSGSNRHRSSCITVQPEAQGSADDPFCYTACAICNHRNMQLQEQCKVLLT